ncbi:MAG: IgGFc-binding protein [Myxococcales bacterium]|nr:IgGFc-binding protein [Myxococcales bacterium]MCB9522371.1 IgGFc-binding protein [Myxococcales bacterium]
MNPLSMWGVRLGCALMVLGALACDDDEKTAGADAGAMTDGGQGDGGQDCAAGSRRCGPEGQPQVCLDPGGWQDDAPCLASDECVDGECRAPRICEPGEARCRDERTLETCNAFGTAFDPQACAGDCREAGGSATCDDEICVPGETRCNGEDLVVQCNAVGTGFELAQRCDRVRAGEQCDQGECVPLCVLSEKVKTNVGCDYWAADLDNAFVRADLDAASAPFAVVVSNPDDNLTAQVSVLNNEEQVEAAIVPPLGLHVFLLPRRDVDGTVLAPLAYRVRSSVPIIAYQFNPLENEDVFSNDASLLLPSHVLGRDYFVMTREQSFDRLRGYVTVIGINEEPTTVSVTVTAVTRQGAGIPALQPGETFEAVLNQFDVLSLQTNGPGADLTGSRVQATQDVVVFGGSEAANVPNTNHCVDIDPVTGEGVCEYDRREPCRDNYDCNEANLNTCCADHLEQQLFPIATWGRHYIASKSYDRGLESDYWRVLAAQDDTKIETVPPQAEIPTLNAGQWYEFPSREHFEIVSDKPIMVGQFLAAEQAPDPNLRDITEPGDAGTGDPAFILAVPVEQFRDSFVFLAPDKYAFDYVTIIAPVAAEVFFDDLPVPVAWEPVGDGAEFHIARFPIGDGMHFIQADLPVAVVVYGYDEYVSYGYPGGLNLDVVDPETGEGQ